MTTSVYPIHRAIGRPIQFKGLQGQYILIAAGGVLADLFLFILLYCCRIPVWLCVVVAFGSSAGVISVCVAMSRKYGVAGWRKAAARRLVPSSLEYRSRRSIAEISESGLIASPSGAITAGFELSFHGCHQAPEVYEGLNQVMVKAIAPFPAGTVFLQQDRFFCDNWKPAADARPRSFLGECSDAHFAGRSYFEHKTYFFITQTSAARPVSWGSSALLRHRLVPSTLLDEEAGRNFLELVAQFEYTVRSSKLCGVRRLTADELRGDDNGPGVIEQYCTLNPPGALPQIGDVAFAEDGVCVLDRPCVIYTLADAEQLPEQCSPWGRFHPYSTATTTLAVGTAAWLGPLLPVGHVVNSFIVLPDRGRLLADLERKLKRLTSVSGYARENLRAREDVERFLQAAAAGQLSPVRAHTQIIAWADDAEKLSELKQQVSAAITKFGATPRLETVGAPQLWYAGIPGNADQLPVPDTFVTFLEQAVCFLVKDRFEADSGDGFGIRVCERHSGRPIHVDISDEPKRRQWINNLNKAILASSGGGKTYLMLLLVRSYFDFGAHIVTIDIGGSYRRLCELLKGQYFAYTEQQPIRFNPFRLDNTELPDTEKKESLISLLLTLWKKSDEPYRRSEYIALSNALHGFYQHLAENPDTVPCFDSFYAYVRDVSVKPRREDFDFENFLYVLKPYYAGGEYDYLLNAADLPGLLDQRLIVFDIDAIRDHPILFPVVTIIIMEVFIAKMRRLHGVRKVIIIEEAWKAIAKQGMDEYIKYLFKTVRKFNGEAIVVTQEIEDIISSPVVRNTIINNADLKILPDQGKLGERFDQLQKALGLSDHEKAAAASVNKSLESGRKYKEAAFCYANGPCCVYAIETSLEEYLAFTSEETERVAVNRYAAETGSLEMGIRGMAKAIRSRAIKLFLLALFLIPQKRSNGQVLEVVEIINEAVKKAIVAADLEVQRLQTQTIALQDAEKQLENSMAGDLLDDITGWVEQQEQLYGSYYQELWQVKTALGGYSKAATLIERQAALVREEQRDWAAVQKDPHFTLAELGHIGQVYAGLLNESGRNVQQISLVIKSFITQMDDAGRLEVIDETNRTLDADFSGLRLFTQQNSLLSLQRARDANDVLTIKALYNLQ